MLLGCRLMEILVLFIMVRIRAPQPNKKHPTGVFFIWYSHGLCKYVSHLHCKTLLMFCNHFGKSQISQNGNGGTPPSPRVRPNQKLKRPCGVFIFGLWPRWPRFATRNQRLPVRKQVDLTSTAQSNRHGFPAAGVITPCEGIRAPRHTTQAESKPKVSNRHEIAQKYAGFLGKRLFCCVPKKMIGLNSVL